MLRLRLAYLALASGLLVTLSGCGNMSGFGGMSGCGCSGCSSGCGSSSRLFGGGLFSRNAPQAGYGGADCDCHNSYLPPTVDYSTMPGPGPNLVAPGMMTGPMPVPITNVPPTQPPIFRVPQASPMPYAPTQQH